ncbi:hypothetical protein LQV63_12260 [Paenibacillus profundus]|uniref:Colicin D C-terminal domain-containing protein n=1 Tax=Paenibacillus profundus TaxID=1173085 RepID=A0ABS8YFU7_9BACL|nr:hypothetical protein [Paenibacillus profundus]MCE5170084.1 hypothetical protein [Paenibacillus profundus]
MKEAYKSLKPQVLKAANEAAQRLKPIKDSALTVIGGDRERSIDGVVTGEWALSSKHGHIVYIDKKTGEVRRASADYEFDELDQSIQQDILNTWKSIGGD